MSEQKPDLPCSGVEEQPSTFAVQRTCDAKVLLVLLSSAALMLIAALLYAWFGRKGG